MEPEVVTMQSKWVQMGSVRRFDLVSSFKPQAIAPLERAVDVYQAWKAWKIATWQGADDSMTDMLRRRLLDACADLIQATLNLVAALGVEDFRPYMKACERRNRERERITDGRPGDGE